MRIPLIAALMTFLIMAAGHTAVITAKLTVAEAALEACSVTAGLTAEGKPDMQAIRACMMQKGFHHAYLLLAKAHKSPLPDEDTNSNG